MVEDTRRGLFSYDALRTRLQESRYAARAGLRDVGGTVVKLEPLAFEEIFVLLQRLRYLHAQHHGYPEAVTDEQLTGFMQETLSRLGADRFTTPREVIRDFVAVLNLLRQNPDTAFDALVHGAAYVPSAPAPDLESGVATDDTDGLPNTTPNASPSAAGAGASPSTAAVPPAAGDEFRAFTL